MAAVRWIAIAVIVAALTASFWMWRAGLEPKAPPPPAPAPVVPDLVSERRPVPVAAAPAQRPTEQPKGVPAAWAAKNHDAIVALEAGEIERAIELFEECIAALPAEPKFKLNLAEALTRLALRDHERRAPCQPCIEMLERAVALAPERTELAELAARWKREAQVEQGFWSESSLHFELSYDGARSDLLWGSTRILNELEKAYADLCQLFAVLPVEDGRPPIRVVLYRREGFSLLTGLGDWAGGAFDGTLRIPITDLAAEESRLSRVLRHELTHAFVREVGGPSVPGWLNEGIAQLYELPSESAIEAEVAAARKLLRGHTLFPLSQLAGGLSSWKDEAAIATAYQESLAFAAYLRTSFGERTLIALIEGIKRGETPDATLRRLTGTGVDQALEDLAQSL
jgi:hypothetical protein